MSQERQDPTRWRTRTRLVRGGTARSGFSETSEALFMTSGYVYASAEEAEAAFKGTLPRFVYSRFGNPTVQMLEERLAMLEGAAYCRATASGMAAVFASMACFLGTGSRVVASRALFGSCQFILAEILPRYGVQVTFVDGRSLAAWEEALAQGADCVFLESPSNPMLEIVDIPRVASLAKRAGARLIVDNVFATPMLQKPMPMGADVVVYSATKHIDGQGRCLGGAILTDDKAYFEEKVVPFVRNTGPALSPFNAWLLLKGLETLALRVAQHCANALAVATYLEARGDLGTVLYPELPSHPQHALAVTLMSAGSSIVTFDTPDRDPSDDRGDKAAAYRFLNGLKMIDISNNLGDAKSLATHPATTTHQRLPAEERAALRIREGTVRLSIGLEDPDDIIADLDQSLAAALA